MKLLSSKYSGMTLIEVLIASVILFIAIGTVSGVQRVLNYYQQLNQMDYVLLMNQQSFFDYVEYSLEQKIYSGEYESGDYTIVWQSQLEKQADVVNSFDPELNTSKSFSTSGKIKLFNVVYSFKHAPNTSYQIKQVVTEYVQAATGF